MSVSIHRLHTRFVKMSATVLAARGKKQTNRINATAPRKNGIEVESKLELRTGRTSTAAHIHQNVCIK